MKFPEIQGVKFAHIPGFPGYCASDDGSIWSCRRRGSSGGYDDGKWRKLKSRKFGSGSHCYPVVTLCKDGVEYTKMIHHLILESFVGPRPMGMVARHFPDRNVDNCKFSNLCYGTQKENIADKKVHGTYRFGASVGGAKLDDDKVRSIKDDAASGDSQRVIAKRYGVSQANVYYILSGKYWSHVS